MRWCAGYASVLRYYRLCPDVYTNIPARLSVFSLFLSLSLSPSFSLLLACFVEKSRLLVELAGAANAVGRLTFSSILSPCGPTSTQAAAGVISSSSSSASAPSSSTKSSSSAITGHGGGHGGGSQRLRSNMLRSPELTLATSGRLR